MFEKGILQSNQREIYRFLLPDNVTRLGIVRIMVTLSGQLAKQASPRATAPITNNKKNIKYYYSLILS